MFAVIFVFSLFGFSATHGYGGISILASIIPTTVTSINVPLTIFGSQKGSITKSFGNGSSAKVKVPKGAVDSLTTFKIEQFWASNDKFLADTEGAFIVGNQVFNIYARNVNDDPVQSFDKNLKITLKIPNLSIDTTDLGVYWFDDAAMQWILVPGTIFDLAESTASFDLDYLAQFAIMKVAGTPSTLLTNDNNEEEKVSYREANEVFDRNYWVHMNDTTINIYDKLVKGKNITEKDCYSIAYFIHNGTPTTKSLGAGERAGVINSFRVAFDRLPKNETDWQDIIKIANGRWPSQRNLETEDQVVGTFGFIYQRMPNMEKPNDNVAVTMMAYGLRPNNRNMDSEFAAINIFETIYGTSSQSAEDWDAVRAIAYSGATR